MLYGIQLDRLLLFWWIAGSLVSHAWRGDAEDDDTNTSEAEASEVKLKVYDVFSEAHDLLLRAKQASLIQQNTGLLATRDALLHSLKDGKPAGTDSGGAGHGNTTSLPYPYTSFVSSEPSAVDPSSKKPSAVNQSAQKQNPETPPREAVEPSEPHEKVSRQTSPEIVPTTLGLAPPERLGLETQVEGEPRTAKDSAETAWIGKDFSDYLSKVEYTVIRITAVTEEVNWFEPYAQPQANEYTGSGFAVYTDENCRKDPVFITNAHVVRDARDVQVTLPGIPGQRFFDAYVPLICEEYDLAVVQLINATDFLEALDGKTEGLDSAKVHGKLQTLVVEDLPLKLGLEVASVGFPLGSPSLKLSRGVISGTEEVNYMCYQTTAPISPGSSGGPLFALNPMDRLQVIGVTFASAASAGAQNTNYVVPTLSILQVMDEFKRIKAMAQESPEEELIEAMQQRGKGGASIEQVRKEIEEMREDDLNAMVKKLSCNHHPFRIAPVDAECVEVNQALYQSEMCQNGVYISKILSTSIFAHATQDFGQGPVLSPIPERCFLTKVGDIALDHLGMGVTNHFLENPTPFQSLLVQKASEKRTVPISICKNGKTVPYQVNLTWNDEWYSMGVKDVTEPHYDKEAMDYEVFAGITLMPLSIQHIVRLLKWGGSPTVGRWLMPENQQKGHLLITHVQEGIYASRVLFAGMVVKEVNGKEVNNLQDFRDNFEPEGDTSYWQLVTDRDVVFMTDFVQALTTQLDMAQEGLDFLMTPLIMKSATKYLAHHNALPTDEDQRSKTLPQGNRSTATGNLGGVFTINIQVHNQRKDVRGGAAGINLHVPPYGVNRTGQQNRISATADTAQRVIRSSKGRSLIMRPSFPEEYTGSRSWQNLGNEPELEAHHQRAQVTGAGFAALSGVSRHGLSSLAETPL